MIEEILLQLFVVCCSLAAGYRCGEWLREGYRGET